MQKQHKRSLPAPCRTEAKQHRSELGSSRVVHAQHCSSPLSWGGDHEHKAPVVWRVTGLWVKPDNYNNAPRGGRTGAAYGDGAARLIEAKPHRSIHICHCRRGESQTSFSKWSLLRWQRRKAIPILCSALGNTSYRTPCTTMAQCQSTSIPWQKAAADRLRELRFFDRSKFCIGQPVSAVDGIFYICSQ